MAEGGSQPDPRQWDGPVPGAPDPEFMGPAMTAWYALHGEFEGDPADILAWAAAAIAKRLGAFGQGVANPLTPGQTAVAINDATLLLGMVAEIFGRTDLPADDEAALAFKAELKRRRGRPVTTGKFQPHSLAWWGVAREVEALMATGDLQKVAVGKVAKRLGLRDAVVAKWCRERRMALERDSWRSGDTDNSAN